LNTLKTSSTSLSQEKNIIVVISVNFNIIDKLIKEYFVFVRYLREEWEENGRTHKLLVEFNKSYDLCRGNLYAVFSQTLVCMQN
jgi:hypothetical protein